MRSDQVMDSPADMAAAYRAELRRLLDAVDRIPADLLSAPIHGDWTIKELLVHLAGWDRAVAASADDVLAGRGARLRTMLVEDVNEDLVEHRRGVPLDEVRNELMEAHQGLLDRLAACAPARWHESLPGIRWPDNSPMTPATVFAYRYHGLTHYGGHAEEVEAWLQERSGS
jgi:uncharacterized protein (TIGR03083 family)